MPQPRVGWLCLFWDSFILSLTGTHGHKEAKQEMKIWGKCE